MLSIDTGKSGEETSHKGGRRISVHTKTTTTHRMLQRENNDNNNNNNKKKKKKKNDKVRERWGMMMGSRIDLDRWFFL